MSAPLDSRVYVEWIVARADELDADWQHVECCAAPTLLQPVDPQPHAGENDGDWWPGRCIP